MNHKIKFKTNNNTTKMQEDAKFKPDFQIGLPLQEFNEQRGKV